MNKHLTLGSLFDGSGGFPLGGLLSCIIPVWASEIEPFPIRVTTKRLPSMKHYGDVSTMNGGDIEPVDIITFGSPCQDLSVAGKRGGLENGERSNLFYQAIRIIKEMRSKTNGQYPRYIVWENVPGAFSSNQGQDFLSVLEAVCSVKTPDIHIPQPSNGKWNYAGEIVGDDYSVAWRVLDAQHWGVPQRRRRIFLVADFGSRRAGEILFESESVSRDFAPCIYPWKRIADGTSACVGATGYDAYNGNLTGNVEATLGVNCGMSTGRNGVVLNDQGGKCMSVTEEKTETLRAEAHHPPCILESAGFCTEHSSASRTIGYEFETSPTIRAGVVPAAIALENHAADGRIKIEADGTVQTLTSRMGTGGMNVPLLMNTPNEVPVKQCAWDGGQISPTLTKQNAGGNQRMPDKDNFNCVLEAYGICAKDSNAMKSPNPHSGIYKADTSRTIDGNGGNPTCNQGGIAVVETHAPDDSVYCMTTGSYTDIGEEVSPTLMARDYKDPNVINQPVYGIGRDTFNQGTNAQFSPTFEEELEPPLMAKGPSAVVEPHGFDPSASRDVGQYVLKNTGNTVVNGTCPGHHNGVVGTNYSVRRLTPTECARLQGFPDWWCSDLGTENPSYADIAFWKGVFDTYHRLMDSTTKPKTHAQIIKWLKDPYSDAAEYKMWGNGVALPCVVFVLSALSASAQK